MLFSVVKKKEYYTTRLSPPARPKFFFSPNAVGQGVEQLLCLSCRVKWRTPHATLALLPVSLPFCTTGSPKSVGTMPTQHRLSLSL